MNNDFLSKYIFHDLKKIKNNSDIHISGINSNSFTAYLLACIYNYVNCDTIFILDKVQDIEEILNNVKTFISKKDLLFFPEWEIDINDNSEPLLEIISDRFKCFYSLLTKDKPKLIVSSSNALNFKTISKSFFHESCINLKNKQEFSMQDLITHLSKLGYNRVNKVTRQGEFAVRGGIFDFFTLSYDDPVRIEFFDNEIESIRFFDYITQTSIKKIENVLIMPINEKKIILDKTQKKLSYLTEYLDENAIVVFKDFSFFKKNKNNNEFLKEISKNKKIYFEFLLDKKKSSKEIINFSPKSFDIERFNSFRVLIQDLIKKEINIKIFCANKGEKDRLLEILEKENFLSLINEKNILIGYLNKGFILQEKNIAFFSYNDFFKTYSIRKSRSSITHKKLPIFNISELQENDLVVHVNYGIGVFKGIKKINKLEKEEKDSLEKERDYIVISYKDNDILYVPVEQAGLLEKYIGSEKTKPALHKLGSKVWDNEKKEVEKKIFDFASELLEVQAKRKIKKGFAFLKDNEWQKEFENSFLFKETNDQITALRDVKKDMESSQPMDRLICGDVGFGKTEVAMRAVFKAVMSGKQAGVLVPTTILAEQHYNNFKQRMSPFPVNIEMLSRFRSKKEQKEILIKLKEGNIDIIIGTHRLVQDDVFFKDIGLLVIDEEQRFGVKDKEKIKKLKSIVDVLTMTATPIPRTLYMSLTGIKDTSPIDTPPEDRLAIYTETAYFDNDLIKKAILRELKRDGQVFFVHNRVNSIDKIADLIRNLVPFARVAIGHGQMCADELEDVMIKFINKEYDVLVCTTIIESGVDIPNVNTIFIDKADKFGLADLYQLRGRVGRFKHRAYAYFLIDKNEILTSDAEKRLSAINEFTSLGSGYKIALRDLEIRGTGNILGQEQHGYIAKVGFDMYCNLLRKTISNLKGEQVDYEPSIIDLGIDLSINENYIFDISQRLEIYRKIASINNINQLKNIKEEIIDRFGKPICHNLELLIKLAELKIISGEKGFIYIKKRESFIYFISKNGSYTEKIDKNKINDKEYIIEFIYKYVNK